MTKPEPMLCFHLKEAEALSRLLIFQYISYEDLEAKEAADKLFKFVEERKNELGRADSPTT